MNIIYRLLITAVLILVLPKFIPGITVTNFSSSIILAVVLGLLQTFLKPILSLFAMPITFLTLGLFSLVINAVLVLIADYFVDGIQIKGFVTALIFSVILSVCQALIYQITDVKK